MAPEQALGQRADRPCDIYSLGIVAYEMLTGAPPFAASSPVACLMKHVNEPFPVPDRQVVSTALAKVLEKALAKDPKDCWPTATALVEALAENVNGNGKQHPGVRWIAATGAILVCAVLALVALRSMIAPVSPARPPLAPGESRLPVVLFRLVDRMSQYRPVLTPVRPARERVAARGPTGPVAPVDTPTPIDTPTSPVSPGPPAPVEPTNDVRVEPPVSNTKAVDAAPTPVPPPSDIVSEAVIAQRVEPIYPPMARAAAIEGNVLVEAECGLDGRVINIKVVRPAHRLLDQAATDAVRQYRCQPRLRNGQPEVSSVRVPPIVFALK